MNVFRRELFFTYEILLCLCKLIKHSNKKEVLGDDSRLHLTVEERAKYPGPHLRVGRQQEVTEGGEQLAVHVTEIFRDCSYPEQLRRQN